VEEVRHVSPGGDGKVAGRVKGPKHFSWTGTLIIITFKHNIIFPHSLHFNFVCRLSFADKSKDCSQSAAL
jgi:hypothetical protein